MIDEEKEEVIKRVRKMTGYDKNIIGCWLDNFKQPTCSVHKGDGWQSGYCKHYMICDNMEGKFSE